MEEQPEQPNIVSPSLDNPAREQQREQAVANRRLKKKAKKLRKEEAALRYDRRRRTILVRNLAFSVDVMTLLGIFQQYGCIERIGFHPRLSKGLKVALIEYEYYGEARLAYERELSLHRTLGGIEITVAGLELGYVGDQWRRRGMRPEWVNKEKLEERAKMVLEKKMQKEEKNRKIGEFKSKYVENPRQFNRKVTEPDPLLREVDVRFGKRAMQIERAVVRNTDK
jgi:hypothetical protein